MRNFISTSLVAAAVLVSALVACGGGDNTTPPPATPTAPTVVDAGAPPGPTAAAPVDAGTATPGPTPPVVADTSTPHFNDLPKDKKVEIMMTKVVPNVGKDFKDFDGKRFEKFGCATCHGPKKNQDPHEVLPKLTMSNGGFEKMKKNKPDMVKLMVEKVAPDMAAALGEKPFDPATHTGFGCGGCHEVK